MTKLKSMMLAAVASVAIAGPAFADYRDFDILNGNRGASIITVWVAHAGTNEPWKPVSLTGPIYPGERRHFDVDAGLGDDVFDFRVKFNDGYVATFSNVNLRRVGTLSAT